MSFGYLGDTSTKIKQQVRNQGVISISEAYELQKAGHLSGSLELIASSTFSSTVSVVDFTSIKESVYDVHFLQVQNFKTATTNNQKIGIQLFESGTIETADVYQYALQRVSTNATSEERSHGDNIMQMDISATGGGVGKPENFYCYLYNLGDSSKYSFATSQSFGTDAFAGAGTVTKTTFGASLLPQASVVDGIRVTTDTAVDLLDFDIKLYGVKE